MSAPSKPSAPPAPLPPAHPSQSRLHSQSVSIGVESLPIKQRISHWKIAEAEKTKNALDEKRRDAERKEKAAAAAANRRLTPPQAAPSHAHSVSMFIAPAPVKTVMSFWKQKEKTRDTTSAATQQSGGALSSDDKNAIAQKAALFHEMRNKLTEEYKEISISPKEPPHTPAATSAPPSKPLEASKKAALNKLFESHTAKAPAKSKVDDSSKTNTATPSKTATPISVRSPVQTAATSTVVPPLEAAKAPPVPARRQKDSHDMTANKPNGAPPVKPPKPSKKPSLSISLSPQIPQTTAPHSPTTPLSPPPVPVHPPSPSSSTVNIPIPSPTSPCTSPSSAIELNTPSLTSQQPLTPTSPATQSEKDTMQPTITPHVTQATIQPPSPATLTPPPPPPPSLPLDPTAQRERVRMEILTTEQTYVTSLNTLVSEFIHPLKLSVGDYNMTLSDINGMFGNVELLYNFHRIFLMDLSSINNDNKNNTVNNNTTTISTNTKPSQTLSDVILKYCDFLKMYTQYLNNYTTSLTMIDAQRTNSKFQHFLAEKRAKCGGLDLMSYLIMPVQRIPRYELLLRELLKYTPVDHIEHNKLSDAYSKIQSIASHVNEARRHVENMSVLMEIQNSFQGDTMSDSLLQPHRRLIREGNVMKFSGGLLSNSMHPRKLYVFSDILLWCNGNKFRGYGRLDHMTITEWDSGKGKVGMKLYMNGPSLPKGSDKEIIFVCQNITERNEWLDDIRSAEKTINEQSELARKRKELNEINVRMRQSIDVGGCSSNGNNGYDSSLDSSVSTSGERFSVSLSSTHSSFLSHPVAPPSPTAASGIAAEFTSTTPGMAPPPLPLSMRSKQMQYHTMTPTSNSSSFSVPNDHQTHIPATPLSASPSLSFQPVSSLQISAAELSLNHDINTVNDTQSNNNHTASTTSSNISINININIKMSNDGITLITPTAAAEKLNLLDITAMIDEKKPSPSLDPLSAPCLPSPANINAVDPSLAPPPPLVSSLKKQDFSATKRTFCTRKEYY